MSFTRTTIAKAPKLTRRRIPRFEKTKEWGMLRDALEQGLKPTEAVDVFFSEAEMRKYRITNRRTVARYVAKYIAANKLPYTIKSFGETTGFHVQVYRPQK